MLIITAIIARDIPENDMEPNAMNEKKLSGDYISIKDLIDIGWVLLCRLIILLTLNT